MIKRLSCLLLVILTLFITGSELQNTLPGNDVLVSPVEPSDEKKDDPSVKSTDDPIDEPEPPDVPPPQPLPPPPPDTDKPADTTPVPPTPPPRQTVRVTIPEGWTFVQIANSLQKNGVCTSQQFYDAAQNYTVKSFTIPVSSNRCFKLEGYLYPDTYDFYVNDDPVGVIRKMLNNYAAKSGMPSDETLILASIIEKEARTDKNMKLVSSVLTNRLKQNMRLECDSTREYVNDFITGQPLLTDTAKYAALYNTYKCAALPAGPICNPGARAIAAAKNPTSSEYLFFFFGNDNENHYAATLAEHEEQKQQYGVQYK